MGTEDKKVLVTGALGQIGSELYPALQQKYGLDNVVGLDIRDKPKDFYGIFEKGDVTNKRFLREVVEKHSINEIYHLVAILSAKGEQKPDFTWRVNVKGLKSILDLALENKIRVFWPSSIAVFGPTTPKDNTPQRTVLEPTTMYGVTKLCGEILCQYHHLKFGVDVRSVRFPGIISYKTLPGGGTTDYAVEIFHEAIKNRKYTCFVKPDTMLPMMYIDDAINAAISIMEASSENIKIRTSYNVAAISFSAQELAKEIKDRIPEFEITYNPDYRQKIADSWPRSIDDSLARKHWGWKHEYDLSKITDVMLEKLREKVLVS